jgi:hypothetical protein
MYNPYTLEVIIELHRQDLLQEAMHYRLLRQARQARTPLYCRLLASVGSLLIAAGQKLQKPYILAAPGKVETR